MTVVLDMKAGHVREVTKTLCNMNSTEQLIACFAVSCPTSVIEGGVGSTQTSAITIGSSGTASVSATAATDLTRVPACSGRGVCRTMRELANGFDGR